MAAVKLDELLEALEYVGVGESFDAAAYVSRDSGEILWVGPDLEPEEGWPADLEGLDRFIAVPTKQELALGRSLALRFTEAQLPEALDEVRRAFARAGAYGRFKTLLERSGQLEAWYAFEAEAQRAALREWCAPPRCRPTEAQVRVEYVPDPIPDCGFVITLPTSCGVKPHWYLDTHASDRI